MTSASVRPPLRFQAPASWPEPSPAWVSRNQGWQPPAGWLPPIVAGWPTVSPAPRGWQFWAPEPGAWQEFREPFRRAAKRQILIGSLLFGIGSIVTILGLLGDLGGTILILWGMIFFGLVRLASGLLNLRKADRSARTALMSRSMQVRRDQDAAAYPHYLAETARERAETGRRAMTFDEFSSAQDTEPWGMATFGRTQFGSPEALAPYGSGGRTSPTRHAAPYPDALAGNGPAVTAAGHGPVGYGPPSPWNAPEVAQRSELSIRRRFWIPLAVLGGLLIALVGFGGVFDLTHSASSSSTVGSAPVSGSGRQWPAHTGNYDLTGVDYVLVDNGSCSSPDGCFQVDITAPTSCAAATITWGFSDSKDGDDKAVRTSLVALQAGQATHVTVPIDTQLSTLNVIFLDSIDCA